MRSESELDSSEKIVIGIAAILVVSFLSFLLYASFFLDIGLPTCITSVKPFQKGEVESLYDGVHEKYQARILARMWRFEPDVIDVKVGAPVEIYLTSLDVVHGFEIEGTRVNLMAVPGTVNYAKVTFPSPGEYRIICHEYCGVGHQNMMAKFVVHGGAWNPDQVQPEKKTEEVAQGDTDLGKSLLQQKGCTGCHTTTGERLVGPSFKSLYGHTENLEDGSSVIVDADYLKTMIRFPGQKVVKGYQPIMPAIPLTDKEVDAIIAHLKTLK